MDNLSEVETEILGYKSRIAILENRMKNLEKALQDTWDINNRQAQKIMKLQKTEDEQAVIRDAVRVFKRLILSAVEEQGGAQ